MRFLRKSTTSIFNWKPAIRSNNNTKNEHLLSSSSVYNQGCDVLKTTETNLILEENEETTISIYNNSFTDSETTTKYALINFFKDVYILDKNNFGSINGLVPYGLYVYPFDNNNVDYIVKNFDQMQMYSFLNNHFEKYKYLNEEFLNQSQIMQNYKQILENNQINNESLERSKQQLESSLESISSNKLHYEEKIKLFYKLHSFCKHFIEVAENKNKNSNSVVLYDDNIQIQEEDFEQLYSKLNAIEIIIEEKAKNEIKLKSYERILKEKDELLNYMTMNTTRLETCVSKEAMDEINELKMEILQLKEKIIKLNSQIDDYIEENKNVYIILEESKTSNKNLKIEIEAFKNKKQECEDLILLENTIEKEKLKVNLNEEQNKKKKESYI